MSTPGHDRDLTYHVWTESVASQRQPTPSLAGGGISRPFWRWTEKILGTPLVQFWMLKEIIKGYKSIIQVEVRYASLRLVAIDLCFPENTEATLKKLYAESRIDADPNKLVGNLEQWLTEQANAHIDSLRKKNKGTKWPDVCVRCIPDEWTGKDMGNTHIRLPNQDWGYIRKTLFNIAGGRQNTCPPFWVRYQHPLHWAGAQIPHLKVLAPEIFRNTEIKFQQPKMQAHIGLSSFTDKNLWLPTKDSRLSLIDPVAHMEAVWVIFPSDQRSQIWVRHLNQHETWVISGGKWARVSDSAWAPVRKGNRIVLGRVIKSQAGYIVVGGSVILNVE